MRIAVISDVHNNSNALYRVLKDIEKNAVDRIVPRISDHRLARIMALVPQTISFVGHTSSGRGGHEESGDTRFPLQKKFYSLTKRSDILSMRGVSVNPEIVMIVQNISSGMAWQIPLNPVM